MLYKKFAKSRIFTFLNNSVVVTVQLKRENVLQKDFGSISCPGCFSFCWYLVFQSPTEFSEAFAICKYRTSMKNYITVK